MMRIFAMVSALALVAPAGAQPQGTTSGFWNFSYNQGIGEYSTGDWDRPTGGALLLSCLPGGRVSIATQIKGKEPPPGSVVRLSASSRAGTVETRFTTGTDGAVSLSRTDTTLRRLWASLRGRDIVTVRYPDNRFVVLSLTGAAKLLPAKPCG